MADGARAKTLPFAGAGLALSPRTDPGIGAVCDLGTLRGRRPGRELTADPPGTVGRT